MAGREIEASYRLVENDFGRIDGVLRRDPSSPSRVVLLETHPRAASAGNLNAWPCLDLPARGIDTFAYNNRYSNSTAGTELVTVWEPFALDVAAAVQAMRELGYERVILYGHSAGGPLVSYYQNLAEHGSAVFRAGKTLSGFTGFTGSTGFTGAGGGELRLPAADGVILQNGTAGTGSSFLARLDAAILDEDSPVRETSLDLFDPRNGYDPGSGSATYDQAFLAAYFVGQTARMRRLVDQVRARAAEVAAGRGRLADDGVVVIGNIRAEPASVDLALAATSAGTWEVLPHGRQTARSNRLVVPGYAGRNARLDDGGTAHTYRSFLSYRAILDVAGTYDPDATDVAGCGLDLASTNASTPGNLAGVSVPLLITVGTADTQVHIPYGELAYASAAACADRSLVFIDGAEHDMRPISPAFGDTRAMHLDLLVDWLTSRYL
ncbi:MAG TPA: hypothetical protein VFW92_07540 [Candidatus Limnocylindrales bacterium]|nr:hypothetical protein [Candidatus Limnocylindrales bacterium]